MVVQGRLTVTLRVVDVVRGCRGVIGEEKMKVIERDKERRE